ncbi:MAG: hypothetical protein J6A09_04925, partial [Alphaproteobacteria bacterium]|nr:hypothetical protein [Alphaproteobacteria bacterium]
NCGTAQKPYGTLVCYAKQEAKTCADYGYVASCPSGQTGTAHSVKLGATTSTCYSGCQASYFDLTLKGGTCSSSSNSCPFDISDGTVTSATGTNHESTHNNISAGKQLTIQKVGKIGISSITVAYNNSSSTHTLPYTFTMPAYDVRISATPNTNDCMTCETGGTGSGDDDDTKCGTIYFTTATAGINSDNMTASLRNKLKNTQYKVMAFCIATTAQPTLTMSGYVKHMAGTQNVSGDITCYQDSVGEYVDWGAATEPNLKGSEITELYYTDTNGQKVDLLTASGKVYYNGTCLKVGTISKSF